jgi:maleate isomerase
VSLGVADNCAAGRLDPVNLPELAAGLDLDGCDALVLSACVQMPSLPAIATVQKTLDIPVLSAATATTYEVLSALGCDPVVPDAGLLLSGQIPAPR